MHQLREWLWGVTAGKKKHAVVITELQGVRRGLGLYGNTCRSFYSQCLSQGHTISKAEHRLWPGNPGTVLEHLARLIGFGVQSSSGSGLSAGGYLE